MLNDIICVIYMFFFKISLTTPEDVTEDTKQNQRAGRPTWHLSTSRTNGGETHQHWGCRFWVLRGEIDWVFSECNDNYWHHSISCTRSPKTVNIRHVRRRNIPYFNPPAVILFKRSCHAVAWCQSAIKRTGGYVAKQICHQIQDRFSHHWFVVFFLSMKVWSKAET